MESLIDYVANHRMHGVILILLAALFVLSLATKVVKVALVVAIGTSGYLYWMQGEAMRWTEAMGEAHESIVDRVEDAADAIEDAVDDTTDAAKRKLRGGLQDLQDAID